MKKVYVLISSIIFCFAPLCAEANEVAIVDENNESIYYEDYLLDENQLFFDGDGNVDYSSSLLGSSFVDEYENNDTRESAYRYIYTEPVSTRMQGKGGLYSLGMRTGGLYSADDQDWFKAYYQAGQTIFVDIRNIGKKNINIALYYEDEDEPIWDSGDDHKFDGRPEKYKDYYVAKTGNYYIKIYTFGDLPQPNYYFYFGPKAGQRFNFTIQMNPSTITQSTCYNIGETDFREYFPRSATVVSLQLSNRIRTNNKIVKVKEITLHLNSGNYITRDEDGRFAGMLGVSLYSNCGLEGKLEYSSLGIVNWAPTASGVFECEMAPYPGNEVN